jgi:excisionase family DNA binding protein
VDPSSKAALPCRLLPGVSTSQTEESRERAPPHRSRARRALSTSTILDWFEAGRLPGFKLGRVVRFRESEVTDWLEAQRVGPAVGGRRQPEVVA